MPWRWLRVPDMRWSTYICRVSDPKRPEQPAVTYPTIRAVSEFHADRQARDGWCGLLAVDPAVYDRLVVEVARVP